MDLFLGPIPGYPNIGTYSLYQLDRVDSNRHYTIDNVRWMDKANNIANKPAGVDDWSHRPKLQRKARAVEKLTEIRRHMRVLTKTVDLLRQEISKSRQNPA
jgi:hypothetical protein